MGRDPSPPEIKLRGRTRGAWLARRGAERTSLFLKHGRLMAYLRRGMTFERPRAYSTFETAEILSLTIDEQGVPHVRFAVTTRRRGHPDVNKEGLRTLSLTAFADAYCSDVATPAADGSPRRAGAFGRALRGGLRRLLPIGSGRPSLVAAYPEAPAKDPARNGGRPGQPYTGRSPQTVTR
jgi:hypothetical protein